MRRTTIGASHNLSISPFLTISFELESNATLRTSSRLAGLISRRDGAERQTLLGRGEKLGKDRL